MLLTSLMFCRSSWYDERMSIINEYFTFFYKRLLDLFFQLFCCKIAVIKFNLFILLLCISGNEASFLVPSEKSCWSDGCQKKHDKNQHFLRSIEYTAKFCVLSLFLTVVLHNLNCSLAQFPVLCTCSYFQLFIQEMLFLILYQVLPILPGVYYFNRHGPEADFSIVRIAWK